MLAQPRISFAFCAACTSPEGQQNRSSTGAGAQMVQVRLRFREGHPVTRNRRDHFATRAAYTFRIRKLVPKPFPERGQNVALLFRRVCPLVQTSLTLREFNALKSTNSTQYFVASGGALRLELPNKL